jgi:hypothetical protein
LWQLFIPLDVVMEKGGKKEKSEKRVHERLIGSHSDFLQDVPHSQTCYSDEIPFEELMVDERWVAVCLSFDDAVRCDLSAQDRARYPFTGDSERPGTGVSHE